MKLLHIIPLLHGGGAEKFCIDLCNELSKEHDVTICALFDVEEHMFMAKALSPDVKVITLNKKLGFDIRMFFKIYMLVKNGNYDAINTHLMGLFNSLPAIVLTKNKFFHTIHSLASKETSKNKRMIYNILFNFFHATPIGISNQVLKSIHTEYGNQFNTLIINGTKRPEATTELENVRREIQGYKKTPSTKVFLTIGRIAPEKNQKMMIEVFNKLISEGEDLILVIIGRDTEEGDPTLSQLLPLAKPEIHFLGMKQNIADYYLCCDAFCLSSLYEGLPITLLEALSLGVISICTPVGGIIDVVEDGENGFLSSDVSEQSFYVAVKRFLSLDDNEKRELSKNAVETFETMYDISTTEKKYIDLYSTRLTSKKQPFISA
ncbi:MAG: glycosyltransferase family 4 protein [Pseudomonadota bacterium]